MLTKDSSEKTIKKIIALLADIDLQEILDDLKQQDENTLSNRSKRDIMSALNTLQAIKELHTTKAKPKKLQANYSSLLNQLEREINTKGVKKRLFNAGLQSVIVILAENFINTSANEYREGISEYRSLVENFYQKYFLATTELERRIENFNVEDEIEFQKNTEAMSDLSHKMQLNVDDDFDDFNESEATLEEINTHNKQINKISIDSYIDQLKKIQQSFTNDLAEFSHDIKNLKKQLADIESNLSTNPNLKSGEVLNLLKNEKAKMLDDLIKNFPEMNNEISELRDNKPSKLIKRVKISINNASNLSNQLQQAFLKRKNLHKLVNTNIYHSIKRKLIDSDEFKALEKHTPKNDIKKPLIADYFSDIKHSHNLDELTKAVCEDTFNGKLSLRQNTGFSGLVYSLFHHGAQSKTDELARKLEKKLENIIQETIEKGPAQKLDVDIKPDLNRLKP